MSLSRSQWASVIGHTGSGKSTLVQHLNAILRPTSGEVVVDGVPILPEKKRRQGKFSGNSPQSGPHLSISRATAL